MAVCAARACVVMVSSSFPTAETICSLMVAARALLFPSAVRHHSRWTPIALTMMEASTRLVMARRIPIRIWLLRLGVLPPARLIRWVSGIHGRVTFQTSSSSVPELRTTLEIGQKRRRSAFTFSISASLASVVTLIKRRIFGNGTSISSSNCVPRRSRVDLGVNRHGFELDAVFLRAFVADDIGTGDQCRHHGFGWRRAHVGAFALLGFIDDRPNVAHGNLRARMGRTVTVNTLGDGGLLFHSNHDVAPVVSIGVMEIRDGSHLP